MQPLLDTPDVNPTLLFWGVCIVAVINALVMLVVLWRRMLGNRPTFAPRWSVADLWFGLQIVVSSLLPLLIPIMLLAFWQGIKMQDLTDLASPQALLWIVLPSAIAQNVAFFGVPAACINLRYRLPLRAIGLPPLPTRRDIIAGILIGVVGMVVSGTLEEGLKLLAHQLKDVAWIQAAMNVDKHNPVADITRALPRLGIGGLLLAVAGIGIAAPLGEEMLFRGFAYNILRHRFGWLVGMFGSALLFTLPHSYGLGLIPVFAMGCLFAWAYRCSGSLWVTILAHATNNTTSVLVAFFFPALLRG